MKSALLTLAILLQVWNLAFGQTKLPYHLSWGNMPFATSYAHVDSLTSISFHSEKDLRKQREATSETVAFDSLGRTIFYAQLLAGGAKFVHCYTYSENGCPSSVYCDRSPVLQVPYPDFSCQNGLIDTVFGPGRRVLVQKYDSNGLWIKDVRLQKNSPLGKYELLDSTMVEYDAQGRYLKSVGKSSAMEVKYLPDSIVIESRVDGKIVWYREIKCGRYGLPISMRTWNYDNRRKKRVLWIDSKIEYFFRED